MALLDVLDTAGSQLRVGYDATHYADFSVSSGGDLTITPTGGDVAVAGSLAVTGGLVTDRAGATGYLQFKESGVSSYFLQSGAAATSQLKFIRSNGSTEDGQINSGVLAWGTTVTTGAAAGDIVVGSSRGLVCTTPDGTKRYRITVDNSGSVTSTLL